VVHSRVRQLNGRRARHDAKCTRRRPNGKHERACSHGRSRGRLLAAVGPVYHERSANATVRSQCKSHILGHFSFCLCVTKMFLFRGMHCIAFHTIFFLPYRLVVFRRACRLVQVIRPFSICTGPTMPSGGCIRIVHAAVMVRCKPGQIMTCSDAVAAVPAAPRPLLTSCLCFFFLLMWSASFSFGHPPTCSCTTGRLCFGVYSRAVCFLPSHQQRAQLAPPVYIGSFFFCFLFFFFWPRLYSRSVRACTRAIVDALTQET